MDFQALLNADVQEFMQRHKDDDVGALALKKAPHDDWPMSLILGQIKTRQKARYKTPEFAENDAYILPPIELYEQVSSQACAKFKAALFSGERFVDLSAGGGVDGYYVGQNFKHVDLIEIEPVAARILAHNLSVLPNAAHMKVRPKSAEDYVRDMRAGDFVYIDPQRRFDSRKGVYDLGECQPNILELLPDLKEKTKRLCIKTSPVLDIEKAARDLKYVSAVYVVEYQGDCKEVLYVLDFQKVCAFEDIRVHAVVLNDTGDAQSQFDFTIGEEKLASCSYGDPQKYIYEPSVAVMKSGGFQTLSLKFDLVKLHQHTHIYTSNTLVENFPGKVYTFDRVHPVKAKGLNIEKADLALRNFPGDVQKLKKKLKLKDGGVHRIYALTLYSGEKTLIICGK